MLQAPDRLALEVLIMLERLLVADVIGKDGEGCLGGAGAGVALDGVMNFQSVSATIY